MRPSSSRRLALLLPWAVAPAVVACAGDDTGTTDDTAIADSSPTDTVAETLLATFDAFLFEVDDTAPTTPTTAPDSGATTVDVADETIEGCRTFGCQCSSNADCLDEQCIEAADGSVCTRSCVADCPANFDCLTSSSFGDPQTVCVPRHTRLCRPCRADAECQATNDAYPAYCLAAADPDQGSFCGSSCANRDCPEGYSCQDAATMGGGTARQCVPNSGMCECRSSWAALGFSTDCVTRNEVGGCDGTRQCTVDGLAACNGAAATTETCDTLDNDCNGQTDDIAATACTVDNANGHCPGTTGCGPNGVATCLGPTPAAESCNGLDDNCNTQTDEAGCDDGLNCTTDACASPNNCRSTVQPGYCVINSACWLSPQYNPQNACEMCDANKSTNTWSQTPNTCAIGGACYPASATNPLNACQICNPNQSTSSWTTSTNTCQIGGQCYLQNDINPANTCEICSPATSTTTWTLAFNTCNIQGQCYAAGAKKPGASCYLCDPTRSTTGWSTAANGAICDDNNKCSTDDHCDGAGACAGNTSCNDNISCTTDVCNAQTGCSHPGVTAGSCRINNTCYSTGTPNPANSCQLCSATTNQTAWSSQLSSVACSDGNGCTKDDHCSGAGTCTPGALETCNDSKTCTNDTCNTQTGACTNALQNGNCLINGTCYTNNTTEPGNTCRKCNTGSSTTAWSLNNGASCNDNDSCSESDTCSNNVCDGTDKTDSYESNASISGARDLKPGASICDNGDWANDEVKYSITATLYGPSDEDWYSFHIDDDCSNSQPSPRIQLTNLPANTNYNVCVYYRCDDWGNGDKGACEDGGGTASEYSLPGVRTLKGCCSQNPGTASEQGWYYPACDNGGIFADNDDGRAYVRVWNASSTWTCSSYTLYWGDQ